MRDREGLSAEFQFPDPSLTEVAPAPITAIDSNCFLLLSRFD